MRIVKLVGFVRLLEACFVEKRVQFDVEEMAQKNVTAFELVSSVGESLACEHKIQGSSVGMKLAY